MTRVSLQRRSLPGRSMDCRIKSGNDDMEDRSRDAFAPEFCVIPLRAISVPGSLRSPGLQIKRRRNAGRRILPNLRAIRARLARSVARTPTGVPPRHLRQRPNATAQLQHVLPGTWLKSGRYPPPPVPVQRVHPRTGRDAGRTFSPKPPGSTGDEPLPAGTALAPPTGVIGRRPSRERDSLVSSYYKQGLMSIYGCGRGDDFCPRRKSLTIVPGDVVG